MAAKALGAPRVTFVKGLLDFSPRLFHASLFLPFSLALSLCLHLVRLFRSFLRPTKGFLTTLDGRRRIARLLLPVNCSPFDVIKLISGANSFLG